MKLLCTIILEPMGQEIPSLLGRPPGVSGWVHVSRDCWAVFHTVCTVFY